MWDKGGLEDFTGKKDGLWGANFSSKLSPWLATGCLSPRRVWREIIMFEKRRKVNKSTSDMKFTLAYRDWTRFIAHKFGVQIFTAVSLQNALELCHC